jgi:predicted GNAT family N-acyltransferase
MRMNELIADVPSGYKQVGFSPRLQRLLAAKAGRYCSHDASPEELAELSARIRLELPGLADDAALYRLRDKNVSIFQVVTEAAGNNRVVGLNAQLPLTECGLHAVLDGTFDPSCPLADHVAAQSETVTAIYAWLIYSPRSFVAVTAALSDYVARYAPQGCSIFCRAANPTAYKVFMGCGYEAAHLSYPGAPSDLLVAHPQVDSPTQKTPVTYEVQVSRTFEDIAKVTAIRAATYMSEQECPFDEEFDGNDFCAAHILGTINGEPAGCIRIRFFATFVKFERLAVRREHRNSKLAFKLVRAAIRFASQKGYERVYGHARHDLVRFWETFGFRQIEGRSKFQFSDIEYYEMEGVFPASPLAVTTSDSPYRLIRPEGAWDRPGPLERAANRERMSRVNNQFSKTA